MIRTNTRHRVTGRAVKGGAGSSTACPEVRTVAHGTEELLCPALLSGQGFAQLQSILLAVFRQICLLGPDM